MFWLPMNFSEVIGRGIDLVVGRGGVNEGCFVEREKDR